MAKKQIILRIYRIHDFDLMSLQYGSKIKLNKAAKKAIVAYYLGHPIKIKVNDFKIPDTADMPYARSFDLNFSDKDAPGIVDWLEKIIGGYRNSFLKNILRFSLQNSTFKLYLNSWEHPELQENADILTEDDLMSLKDLKIKKRKEREDAKKQGKKRPYIKHKKEEPKNNDNNDEKKQEMKPKINNKKQIDFWTKPIKPVEGKKLIIENSDNEDAYISSAIIPSNEIKKEKENNDDSSKNNQDGNKNITQNSPVTYTDMYQEDNSNDGQNDDDDFNPLTFFK